MKIPRENFPQEFFIELIGDPHLEGRLTVNQIRQGYSVEVDLVFFESKKIFRHLTILYGLESSTEAMDQGTQFLSSYLRAQKKQRT